MSTLLEKLAQKKTAQAEQIFAAAFADELDKIGSMKKEAIGPLVPILARLAPLASRALPAIGRFAKGAIGIGNATGAAGKAGMWIGRAQMASSLIPNKVPRSRLQSPQSLQFPSDVNKAASAR